ncbi:Asp23/Gls24 family envelope stress response protein [Opitutaceae bacterium TAV4]|nr:Asp23/Gls24 family envelope stress response protein [Opitutaceae bacterium TAV4]RRK01227.1 Asp23/Gls24 family envelope stress response protein [Opitutaceae bacterium TAV3]
MQPTEPTDSTEFTPASRFDDQPELGDIKINHNVIASIVRLASLQVPGVAGVGGGIVDGITELFAKREADHRGVRVAENSEGAYVIEVRLVISYGSEIGKTAYDVQLSVRKQIIAMTGKDVAKVDVIIEGVRLPGAADSEAASSGDDAWPDAN